MPKRPKRQVLSPALFRNEAQFFSPTVRSYSPLPADHPFYAMVGRVASEWSHLEHILDMTIWDLLSWKTTGLTGSLMASVTSQILGVNPRCKAIAALGAARGLQDSLLKPFRKLKADAFAVAEWRARWVHDPWYMETGSGTPAQFRAMPEVDPRYGIQDIGHDELGRTIEEIKSLQEQATKLRSAVLVALAASE